MSKVDPILSDGYLKLLAELREHFEVHGKVTLPIQLLKLSEEVGEVAESYIGATGANPRKGVTHTMFQVAMELADVAIVAMLAIRMAGFDVNSVLAQQARKTRMRLDEFAARIACEHGPDNRCQRCYLLLLPGCSMCAAATCICSD